MRMCKEQRRSSYPHFAVRQQPAPNKDELQKACGRISIIEHVVGMLKAFLLLWTMVPGVFRLSMGKLFEGFHISSMK